MKRRKWALAISITAVALLVGWRLLPPEKKLYDLAKPVATTEGWLLEEDAISPSAYAWISNSKIVFLQEIKKNGKVVRAEPRYQVVSTTRSPEPPFKFSRNISIPCSSAIYMSPDGKWVKYSKLTEEQKETEPQIDDWTFINLESGHTFKANSSTQNIAMDSQNGSPWLYWNPSETGSERIAVSLKEDNPTKWRFCSQFPDGAAKREFFLKPPFPNANPMWHQTTTSGKLLFLEDEGYFFTSYNIYPTARLNFKIAEVDPNQSDSAPKIYTIALPYNYSYVAALPSPSGKKIVFAYTSDVTLLWNTLLRRINPTFHFTRKYASFIEVCNMDGSNRHEAAHEELGPKGVGSIRLSDLKWLPNEKAVSFTHDGKLYVLRVD